MKKTVVSGAQSSGNLHLGNYLGAIIHWVRMQHDPSYECFFFLADLHAITIDRPPLELRSSVLSSAALYLASGLESSNIFTQSSVKEHTELAWILNCITPIGWLKRMTQFKDKAGKDQDGANLGLFSYPVLMAADILLYNADFVPVGDDQKQHLELTRDIAGIVNRKFDQLVFKLPEPLIQGTSTRVMSLRDGRAKMSKSDPSDFSRINLSDTADQIYQKIKKAKTDSISEMSYDSNTRPEIANLINIYSSLSGDKVEQILTQYQGTGCAKFKNDLAELIITNLAPINKNYNDLMNNQDYLLKVLKGGAATASNVAAATMSKVKELFGFI